MSKKLENMKWESVALEGFPASISDNFQGFVALEECTDYGMEKTSKRNKKVKKKKKVNGQEHVLQKTQQKKRKLEDIALEVPVKKQKTKIKNTIPKKEPVRLSNGFVVETCEIVSPSVSNDASKTDSKIFISEAHIKVQNTKDATLGDLKTTTPKESMKKTKLGDDIKHTKSDLVPEDMLTWAEFKLPEPILKALMELGFKKPTRIQELTLPAAIHGRRDILGAAETGSGKTLAFGLPILTGIMKLKEKAELCFDAYQLPYKKVSAKKKVLNLEPLKKGKKKNSMNQNKKKALNQKAKESSEDGYGSDDEANNSTSDDEANNSTSDDEDNNSTSDDEANNSTRDDGANNSTSGDEIESDDENGDNKSTEPATKDKINKKNKTNVKVKDTKKVDDEECLEEIEVPIRKRKPSIDEGNDSDDSDNYIHLSELLDSDDLADSSDNDDKSETDKDISKNLGEEVSEDGGSLLGDENGDADGSEDDEADEENEGYQGIGCVKVIDNVELPGHVKVKTGKPLYALILTPTRELAIQISRHLTAVAKYTGIKVATIVGGMASVKQERVLASGPEVVVATPGRLWELTQRIAHLQQMHSVRFLAIDETDRMIERGHFEELQPLLERLNAEEASRETRQNFVFSATLTMVHDLPIHMKGKKVTKRGKILNRKIEKMTPEQKVKRLVAMIGMTDPKVVDITKQNLGTAETLTESRITCSLEHKDAHLYYILRRHPGRTIVFCNSIGSVKRLAQLLALLKFTPLPLHASMAQRQRLKNLERFRDNPHGILVATDVAARGLDIPDVEHVVHYQVPRTAENYVHRSGRTARANKEGLTILMMDPSEAFLYGKLCRTLNKTQELPPFPVSALSLGSIRELVSVARDLLALSSKRQRVAASLGWREKAAREMDIIVDDDDLPMKQIDPAIDKELKAKKRKLDSMLSRPLFPKGFSYKYPTLNDPTALDVVEENALAVMKKSLETGELKKEKRKGKNASLLKLQKKKWIPRKKNKK